MKFIKTYQYLLLSGGLLLTSCNVNDLQPQTALSETTAFETPERIELAVAGVYDGGQSGFYNGPGAALVVRGYAFGAAHLEQGDNRGEDMLAYRLFTPLRINKPTMLRRQTTPITGPMPTR